MRTLTLTALAAMAFMAAPALAQPTPAPAAPPVAAPNAAAKPAPAAPEPMKQPAEPADTVDSGRAAVPQSCPAGRPAALCTEEWTLG